jgi:DnaJ-class molecular chaperone
VTCLDCGGTGETYAFDAGWKPETCIRCWGDGEVEQWHAVP